MTKMDKRVNKIREVAQRLADVEVGDFGTLGGNQTPELTQFVCNLQGTERLLFVEYYLAELRVRLLSPNFETDTGYEKRHRCFNPRS